MAEKRTKWKLNGIIIFYSFFYVTEISFFIFLLLERLLMIQSNRNLREGQSGGDVTGSA